jgi:Amt family ammonium transporter
VFIVYPMTKKSDLGISVNGFLGGLVAITCTCYWVSPGSSVIIGAVAGVVVVFGIQLLEYLRIDDPIGAVPVHMFCGIWGTLSLGLFAAGKYGIPGPDGADNSVPVKGLFFGGGIDQLKAQLVGSIACVLIVTSVALIVMYIIRQFRGSWNLRLERDLELEGLDISEHGTPAYHMEFGYGMSYTTPTGSGIPGIGGSKPVNLAESENQPV